MQDLAPVEIPCSGPHEHLLGRPFDVKGDQLTLHHGPQSWESSGSRIVHFVRHDNVGGKLSYRSEATRIAGFANVVYMLGNKKHWKPGFRAMSRRPTLLVILSYG